MSNSVWSIIHDESGRVMISSTSGEGFASFVLSEPVFLWDHSFEGGRWLGRGEIVFGVPLDADDTYVHVLDELGRSGVLMWPHDHVAVESR